MENIIPQISNNQIKAADGIEADKWSSVADKTSLARAMKYLKENGFEAELANSREDAYKKVFETLPEGSEVMNMTSVTLDELGIAKNINESGRFDSVRNKLNSMDRAKEGPKMQKLEAAPEWVVGSVHAITENGQVLIASNSGSQLPAYVYGSSHVIWVVGIQKIVKDLNEAFERIYKHSLPLESERARKAYGVAGSFVSKILIFNKERPGRIKIIFVPEKIGF